MPSSRSSAASPRPWFERVRTWTFGLYLLAAGLATAADSLSFLLLYHLFDPIVFTLGTVQVERELAALAISYPLGVWVQYLLSRWFVFLPGEHAFAPGQLQRFLAVSAVVFLLNHLTTYGLLNAAPYVWMGTQDGLVFWSRTVAAASIGGFSYLMHRLYTFR